MSVIVEFGLQSSELVLSEMIASMPETELHLVQEAGTDPKQPYLIFWVEGDTDAFENRLTEDETVTETERYTSVSDKQLYRARISESVDVVAYPVWVNLGIELIDAKITDSWWEIRARLPDRDTIEPVKEWCDENDVTFELEAVYTDTGGVQPQPNLTKEQREVLEIALDVGYFSVPRDGNLGDIAERLDISKQAVSERLRRGYRQLTKEAL